MSAYIEFANFLSGNFYHDGDSQVYILKYFSDNNTFQVAYSTDDDEYEFDHKVYMVDLIRILKNNDCKLYHRFIEKFPEYFI